ncbi:MAG: ABC transporter permease subunit [Verrucomicrobia bacterium]|nr:ABC transporter permease subunit [Verrucomicrobiota bacterium]
MQDPVNTGSNEAVILLDHTRSRNDINYAAMTADGAVFLQRARGRRNMMTNTVTYSTTTANVDYIARDTLPAFLQMTGLGDNIYLIWEDGILFRFDTRSFDNISLGEVVALTPDADTEVTSIGYMIGKTTLMVGDSKGGVTGWFRVRPHGVTDRSLSVRMREVTAIDDQIITGDARDIRVSEIQTADRLALVPARQLEPPESQSPVVSLTPSERKRMFVSGHADGRIRLHNTTVENLQFEVRMQDNRPASFVLLNPRDTGLLGVSDDGGFGLWEIDVPHSEATLAGYFTKIWYEGSDEPAHTWQSTGGTDDFESKFGLMPLIFGTIKATLYSMIFAVPIAILAAIYTSEFLHPKSKARIKPAIEMMASLPSVVLGFLAGLVLAQYIESRVPTTLLSFITVPYGLILCASLWQLLNRTQQMRLKSIRFLLMFLAIPMGIWVASVMGPPVERALFSVKILNEETATAIASEVPEYQLEYSRDGFLVVRDIRTWLGANRQNHANPEFESHPFGGWLILLTPLCFLGVIYATIRFVNPWLLDRAGQTSIMNFALFDLLKFILAGVAAVGLAMFLAWIFSYFGDARGGVIDHYGQRNALVVGFMMGFAVIPIIYTISDDAMSAVPDHLRSASLGAGATRWQTAVRIIIPTSMSGIFSAVMIGFGRAVGETMIVLMAAGNTPIMEWNIFSGFRTLSANIAVEMMEAVEDSTNYRTLFLAAVILFSMTFVINTFAEKVRQNYRKKAYQL